MPSKSPTNPPTTRQPTHAPSDPPFTSNPTEVPTPLPSTSPTKEPTALPSNVPSDSPTKNPTSEVCCNLYFSSASAVHTFYTYEIHRPHFDSHFEFAFPSLFEIQPTVPAPPSEAPTPMPTNGDDGNGPQLATYDPSLGAPRCSSFGSSCDSQGLLDGRGNVSGGNEPNQPNTLNSCTDGSLSAFYDFSVDKIVVSQAPGIASDFTVGDTVTITATVRCSSTGAYDYLDLYYTSDATATNPVFTQIGERQQCPGGGAQTVTAEYTLPEGEIHAVRVNLMYLDQTVRPGKACAGGSGRGYNDVDDLVFSVKAIEIQPTAPPSEAPTPMPTNQSAAYDPSLGAPKCSFGTSCDSQGLLDGRGNMKNGNEPNQPNTLNSCTDGSFGTYHSDESVDKIVVSQAPGITSDMTVGDTVTITATVWCWNTGSKDFIDLYYTSDATATNPVWIQIGERQQCPGGGAQTLTAEYTLPEGEIQAVRANIMYNDRPTNGDSCVKSGYDDTDDLVISVRSTSGPTPPPSALPTSNPTKQPTSSPSSKPTFQPSPLPTSNPTKQPTSPPSNNPTPQPSPLPTSNPTKQPTSSPSSHPTFQPSPLPTSNPTKQPTSPPSNNPTPQPSPLPTSNPTKQPTSSPSSHPTFQPSPLPTSNPTKQPTSPPSNNPTPQPTPSSPSMKTLVCGRGDVPTNPCDEGLSVTAAVGTIHEIRCCQTNLNNALAYWKKKCPQYNWALYARSRFAGRTCKVGTFAEAVDFCKNVDGDNTRLCTPEELKNSCAKGTGCGFDKEMIWSCAYDGHVCSSDTECCGTCNQFTGKCQGGS